MACCCLELRVKAFPSPSTIATSISSATCRPPTWDGTALERGDAEEPRRHRPCDFRLVARNCRAGDGSRLKGSFRTAWPALQERKILNGIYTQEERREQLRDQVEGVGSAWRRGW